MNHKAIRYLEQSNRLRTRGDDAQAEKFLLQAIRAAPHWADPWFNLGLICKHQGRWQESFDYNKRAADLNPDDEATWWNLGIASTALGEWQEARRAWSKYGVPVPPGEGPIAMELGLVPIRICPDATPEVVWCKRIDPARAIIRNVPMPQCGHRYGDLILHDGEPKGFRRSGGQNVPVFNELALLEASDYSTFEVVIEANYATDRAALTELAEEREMGCEDWSTIRMLCKACSEGTPHSHHDEQPPDKGPLVRYGIAAHDEDDVRDLLVAWRSGRTTCLVHEVTCVLEAHHAE